MSHYALSPQQFWGERLYPTPPQETPPPQFHGTGRVNPHQLALPGMEHMAHPWAGPVSRGYMLDYSTTKHEHHLAAIDVSHPKYPSEAASLDWSRKKSDVPGEVMMVGNYQRGDRFGEEKQERAKGLAGALFHSAHYWNFGQETVPIHSPERSDAGEHFAKKVRPDLKPDVWHNYQTGGETAPAGKPRHEGPIWENVSYGFHPFQREEQAQAEESRKKQSSKLRSRPPQGQGRLF